MTEDGQSHRARRWVGGRLRPARVGTVARHARGGNDNKAVRALAVLSVAAVAITVLVYLVARATPGQSVAAAPLASPSPSAPAAFAPNVVASQEPLRGGQLFAPPPQPASPVPSRSAAGRGGSGAAPAGGGAPMLSVRQDSVPPVVDLTGAGPVDWVHFGRGGSSPSAVDRKRNGSGAIVDLGGGPRGWYSNNPQRFAWNDGMPTPWTDPTPTGVYVCGLGGDFELAVSASATVQTLRLYAGLWRAKGQLTLALSAGSATATAYLENRYTNGTAVFTVSFRAPVGTRLLLHWATIASYDPRCGNVDLQGAALS